MTCLGLRSGVDLLRDALDHDKRRVGGKGRREEQWVLRGRVTGKGGLVPWNNGPVL